MKSKIKSTYSPVKFFWRMHTKITSRSAHLIGPFVFNCGIKEEAWGLKTSDLLKFPAGSVGRSLGCFFEENQLELIAGAESHDLYHVLFGFSSSFKDEVALQFFLRGNGKNSIASLTTAIGAWVILPLHWNYLKASYNRGKKCRDISELDLKTILTKDLEEIRNFLFEDSKRIYKIIR